MWGLRTLHVRAGTIKNFILNPPLPRQCPLGWLWRQGGYGCLLEVEATESAREEGIKQHVSQFPKYFYVHDLFSQSGREEVFSRVYRTFFFFKSPQTTSFTVMHDPGMPFRMHRCKETHMSQKCATQAHACFVLVSLFKNLFCSFILTWFWLMHSFWVLSIFASDSKSFLEQDVI